MKQLFVLQTKRLYSNLVFLILLAVFIGGTTAQHIVEVRKILNFLDDLLSLLVPMLTLSYFFYVFFLFLSFEYLYRLRQNRVDEVITHFHPGREAYYFSGVLVLIPPLVLVTLIHLIIALVTARSIQAETTVYGHIVAQALFNLLAIGLTGILQGACLSRLSNRFVAWLGILILSLLGSPYSLSVVRLIAARLTTGNVILYGIYDLFHLFPPSLESAPLYGFGYSLLTYRLGLVLFWFAFSLLILLLTTMRKQRRLGLRAVALGLSGLLALGGLWWFVRPSDRIIMDGTLRSNNLADQIYYKVTNPIGSMSVAEPDFSITAYQLDIRVHHELHVAAALTMSAPDLADYKMTLYHGYRVLSVTDPEGISLRYSRDRDTLTVFRGDQPLPQIEIRYAGSSPAFSANHQLISLPGYFPWYPHPGHRLIWDNANSGYNRFITATPIPFSLRIAYGGTFYTNLSKEPDGWYRGNSEGVTLVGGFFHEQAFEKLSVIEPFLSDNARQTLSLLDEARRNDALPEQTRQLIVFQGINVSSPYNRVCEFSDHLLVRSIGDLITGGYALQKIDPMKLEIHNQKNQMLKDPIGFWLLMDSMRPGEMENNPAKTLDWQYQLEHKPFARMAVAIEKYSPEFIAMQVEAYVNDASDRRDPITFLKDMDLLPIDVNYKFEKPSDWRIAVEYLLKTYKRDPGHYWSMRESLKDFEAGGHYKEAEDLRNDYRILFPNKVDEYGADFVVAALEAYVKQEQIKQSPDDFLKELTK